MESMARAWFLRLFSNSSGPRPWHAALTRGLPAWSPWRGRGSCGCSRTPLPSLELGQVRQEIDRRIAEKEEEFENSRKNHARAMDSMQASLESEQRAKAEALRIKKKLEGDINELEIALDHANKANSE